MGLIFADSSALVKRYIAEQGSAWGRAWIEPEHGNTIIIAEVAKPGVIATRADPNGSRSSRLAHSRAFAPGLNSLLKRSPRGYTALSRGQ